jgi:hypothetical protein
MFGIISVQTYKYFENFPRDFYYVKIMVGVFFRFGALDAHRRAQSGRRPLVSPREQFQEYSFHPCLRVKDISSIRSVSYDSGYNWDSMLIIQSVLHSICSSYPPLPLLVSFSKFPPPATKALYWYLATHPGNYALLITAVW